MNRRKVLPEVKGGAEREREREREREFYGLKQQSWSKANGERRLVMCRAVAVGGGGGDLPDEGEIGRRQQ